MKRLFLCAALLLGAALSWADSTTSRLLLVQPTIGSTGWGVKTNNNWGLVDDKVACLICTNTYSSTNTFNGYTSFGGAVAFSGSMSFNSAVTFSTSAAVVFNATTTFNNLLSLTGDYTKGIAFGGGTRIYKNADNESLSFSADYPNTEDMIVQEGEVVVNGELSSTSFTATTGNFKAPYSVFYPTYIFEGIPNTGLGARLNITHGDLQLWSDNALVLNLSAFSDTADFLVKILTMHGDATTPGIILDYPGTGIFSQYDGGLDRYKIGFSLTGEGEQMNLTPTGLHIGADAEATHLLDVEGEGHFDGAVGIATGTVSGSTLTVKGRIESLSGGYKFPDGSIQTTAAGAGGRTVVNYVAGASPATGSSGIFIVIATVPANTLDTNGDYVTATFKYRDTNGSGGSCDFAFFGADGFVNPPLTGYGTIEVVIKRTGSMTQNASTTIVGSGGPAVSSQATAFDETIDNTISVGAYAASCVVYEAEVTY